MATKASRVRSGTPWLLHRAFRATPIERPSNSVRFETPTNTPAFR